MLVGIVFLDRKDGYVLTYQEIVTIFQKVTFGTIIINNIYCRYKDRVIPNRITMLLFQSGIFFTMLHCIDLANL